MRFLKLTALDIAAAVALFIVGAVVAGVVHQATPNCYTCGATVGNTVFFTAFFALQPALWLRGYKRDARWRAWSLGTVVGVIVYLVLEFAGTALFGSGRREGLALGSLANVVGPLVGTAFCVRSLRSKGVVGAAASTISPPEVTPPNTR